MERHGNKRIEDARLLSGAGRFAADASRAGVLAAGFLRADIGAGRILSLDVEAALAMPGVRAVLTAADLDRDGIAPLPHIPLPRDDGGQPGNHPQPILAHRQIRHVGEPLALVIADTRSLVMDAIEAIALEVEETAPPEGVAFCRRIGAPDQVARAFEDAAYSASVTLQAPRVTAFALEPRTVIARGREPGALHYRASTQSPFALRDQMAEHFGWPAESIHVEATDVGGSFGLKGYMAVEDAALAWAARRLRLDLAWVPTRSETMLADAQGRGAQAEVAVALDSEHRITAIRADFEVDAGAYPGRRSMGVINNINGLTGVYDIPLVAAEITGRLSARAPLAPFRGNGRPEATLAIEAVLDRVARQNGIDPVALRRRNMIAPDRLPLKTVLGAPLDCGDFPAVMDAALARNGDGEVRRAAAERRGMLYGVGLANCIESAGGPMAAPKPDTARITVAADGAVTVAAGVMSVGQGHETALSQMVARRLEIDLETISYRNGDTAAISAGRGSGGSSGVTVAGSALWQALDRLIDDGRARSARMLGCAPEALDFRDGGFCLRGSNQVVTLAQIAATAPGGIWMLEHSFTPPAATFPNGTHICEVEIDPETGAVRVTRYVAVEDVGRVLNPVLVEGQLHGGIAQGLSVGLGERMGYDDGGQLLTGSLMDYMLVRADDLPMFRLDTLEVPTALNPLGVKGVGEAGTVGATAALVSAVGDALYRAGVDSFDLPATALNVWTALQRARA